MSASLSPRAPGQSGALGLGLGVGCGLPAPVVPSSPGAGAGPGLEGAASVLLPWVWVKGEGARVHILRKRQAQKVRASTKNLQEHVGCKNCIWSLG